MSKVFYYMKQYYLWLIVAVVMLFILDCRHLLNLTTDFYTLKAEYHIRCPLKIPYGL